MSTMYKVRRNSQKDWQRLLEIVLVLVAFVGYFLLWSNEAIAALTK